MGFDHIDLQAAKSRRGILVTNTPEVLSDATAEIAMLLLLGAARRAHERTADPAPTAGRLESTYQLGLQVSGKRLSRHRRRWAGSAIMARRARGYRLRGSTYYNRSRLPARAGADAVITTRWKGCCRTANPFDPLSGNARPIISSMPSVLRCCRTGRWL